VHLLVCGLDGYKNARHNDKKITSVERENVCIAGKIVYIYTVAKKERIFSHNFNFFIFNIKNYVNTKTTRNKCSFDYLR